MKAIIVGLWRKDQSESEVKDSLRELKGLVEAVGGKSVGYVLQSKNRPDSRYFIGEGKATAR